MAKFVSIDPFSLKGFDRAISDLAATIKKDRDKVLSDEMRLLVERLIQLTAPPHGKGGGKEAQRQGEAATRRDILRVFKAMNNENFRKFSKRFSLYSTNSGAPLFAQTLIPEVHEERRNARGRVEKRKDVDHQFGGLTFSDRTHVTNPELNRYLRLKVSHVGSAKGGWNAAAQAFGAKAPAWVSRHGTDFGRSTKVFKDKSVLLEATNLHKAMASIDRKSRVVREAVRSRERDIRRKLEMIIDRAAKKFNKR